MDGWMDFFKYSLIDEKRDWIGSNFCVEGVVKNKGENGV
jgi:hypothetical protein